MEIAIRDFPTSYEGVFDQIDKDKPYVHCNVGLFRLDGVLFDGKAYAYMPKDTECSAWSVTILLPSGVGVEDFLMRSGWKAVADDQKILLFMMETPECGWSDRARANELMRALDRKVDDKTHYDAQRFCAYLVGYSDGAQAALAYALERPASYAGLGLIGSFGGSDALNLASGSDEGDLPYLPLRDIPVPLYIGAESGSENTSAVIEHFRKRNGAVGPFEDEHSGTVYYFESEANHKNGINGEPVANIAIDRNDCFAEQVPSCADRIWNELHKAIRTSGVGHGYLHPYRSLEEWGVDRHEMVVDGIRRHWYEYVPQRGISRQDKKPLVMFLHGGSQTGKTCLYATQWMNVAESRDFIFVAPTGSMRDFGADGAPHPAWNACRSEHLFNDEKFIRLLIDDVSKRLPVDTTRIYVSGHSMGSAMTQRCALALPDVFAAAASNSGVVTGGFMGDFDTPGVREDLPMPAVWIQMGEHDVGGGTLEQNHNAERTVKYWISRGGLRDYDQPHSYCCGRYKTLVWPNKQGFPILSFTTTLDKPHSIMPQDAWFYYDEFFCKYSRDSTGKLFYLGVPVD